MWKGLKTNVGIYQKTHQTISHLRKMTLQRHQSNAKGYINVIYIFMHRLPDALLVCAVSHHCGRCCRWWVWPVHPQRGKARYGDYTCSYPAAALSPASPSASSPWNTISQSFNTFISFCWYSIEQCKRRYEAVRARRDRNRIGKRP